MRSWRVILSIARYSRSHCFTRMENDAVDKLKMRLATQHTLTRMSSEVAWNEEREGKGAAVALMDAPFWVKPPVLAEICWRSWITTV